MVPHIKPDFLPFLTWVWKDWWNTPQWLRFNFNRVDFKVNGPVIGSLKAGMVGKLLNW